MSSNGIIITIVAVFLVLFGTHITTQIGAMNRHRQQRSLGHPFTVDKQQHTAQNENLVGAYLSRGMFSCGAKYVGTLQRLKRIIEEVHADYSECQKSMKQMDEDEQMAFGKGHGTERFAMIDELIN
ncbi:hypothetical protein niasHS_016078 [Heterodera schachtii]|uniref:Uncharacterized protein n=2 Tax=Heterodera TaxID=34509 RepID=A0ABD2I3F3_HETSC